MCHPLVFYLAVPDFQPVADLLEQMLRVLHVTKHAAYVVAWIDFVGLATLVCILVGQHAVSSAHDVLGSG